MHNIITGGGHTLPFPFKILKNNSQFLRQYNYTIAYL